MKQIHYIFTVPVIFITMLSLVTCSDSRAPRDRELLSRNLARVHINLDRPSGREKISFMDRALRFFMTEAVAQEAPAAFSTISITVTGPGMAPVNATYPAGPLITVLVPAGASRLFDIIAFVAPEDPSAARSFRGTAVANLTAGDTVPLPVEMNLHEVKLVLPDFENGRIIQMGDITGTGYAFRYGSDIGLGVTFTFRPYDVDFDNTGRIYIANYFFGPAEDTVIRLENINDTAPLVIDSGVNQQVRSLAIDRQNSILYFATDTVLRKSGLDGTGIQTLDISSGVEPITSITGMDVDADGMLYITGETGAGIPIPRLFRYDPVNEAVVASTGEALPAETEPWDVVVNGGVIYVANFTGNDGELITSYTRSLAFLAGYGEYAPSTDTNKGMFYGPRRFAATINRKLTIIDDSDTGDYDKLISMDNIAGTGWQTFPEGNDSGQEYFQFYYYSGC